MTTSNADYSTRYWVNGSVGQGHPYWETGQYPGGMQVSSFSAHRDHGSWGNDPGRQNAYFNIPSQEEYLTPRDNGNQYQGPILASSSAATRLVVQAQVQDSTLNQEVLASTGYGWNKRGELTNGTGNHSEQANNCGGNTSVTPNLIPESQIPRENGLNAGGNELASYSAFGQEVLGARNYGQLAMDSSRYGSFTTARDWQSETPIDIELNARAGRLDSSSSRSSQEVFASQENGLNQGQESTQGAIAHSGQVQDSSNPVTITESQTPREIGLKQSAKRSLHSSSSEDVHASAENGLNSASGSSTNGGGTYADRVKDRKTSSSSSGQDVFTAREDGSASRGKGSNRGDKSHPANGRGSTRGFYGGDANRRTSNSSHEAQSSKENGFPARGWGSTRGNNETSTAARGSSRGRAGDSSRQMSSWDERASKDNEYNARGRGQNRNARKRGRRGGRIF